MAGLGGLRKRFVTAAPPSPEEIRPTLWNEEVDTAAYDGGAERYRSAVMEQYKLYVEMADRISARRALANTFFITLNSAVLTAVGVFWKDRPEAADPWLALPLVVVLGLCLAWFWLVRSYRQLNSAKYAVIGALEQRLPASPYWRAEWTALGRGEDTSRYWPITHLEQWVPGLFALAYVGGFLAVLLA